MLAVLRSCCSADGDPAAARGILRDLWSRHMRISERSACSLVLAAAESAAADRPGALELLDDLVEGMIGDTHPRASAQRSTIRRTDRAAHEAARSLAISEWRAGRASAGEATSYCLSLLADAGVAPRQVLVATVAHMYASEGNVATALQVLEGRTGVGVQATTEGAYIGVLNCLSHTSQLPDAISVMRSMTEAQVLPTLRTRVALAALLLRMRHTRNDGVEVPWVASFWRDTGLTAEEVNDAVKAFERLDVRASSVADFVVESKSAALLNKIAKVMDKRTRGTVISSHLAKLLRGHDTPLVEANQPSERSLQYSRLSDDVLGSHYH